MDGSVLRLATVTSTQTEVRDATRTVPLVNPDTGRPLSGVTATVRLLSNDDYQAIEKKHREPIKDGIGKVDWKVDYQAVMLEVMIQCVTSWRGVVGADNKPMPLCPAALRALDSFNRTHLAGVARTPAEVVDAEVIAASFREPAAVGALAGG